MATVKILGWPTRTDVVTVGGEVLATLQLQRDRRVTATTSALSNYLGDAEIQLPTSRHRNRRQHHDARYDEAHRQFLREGDE